MTDGPLTEKAAVHEHLGRKGGNKNGLYSHD